MMLEKLARAAFEAWGGAMVASGKPWEAQAPRFRECFRREAIAILQALVTELEEDTMRVGAAAGNWLREMDDQELSAEACAVLQAMIDHILSTGEG